MHDQLCAGGLPTNLVTGQERRQVAGARHTACTTEMASTSHPIDVAVSLVAVCIRFKHGSGILNRFVVVTC